MLTAPQAPTYNAPDLLTLLGDLPVVITLPPLVLVAGLALAGILFAALSVMLVYHWRRFPFDHVLLVRVERLYWLGSVLLIAAALAGILTA